MIQPAKLLKDFGVPRIVSNDTLVRILGADMLDRDRVYQMIRAERTAD